MGYRIGFQRFGGFTSFFCFPCINLSASRCFTDLHHHGVKKGTVLVEFVLLVFFWK